MAIGEDSKEEEDVRKQRLRSVWVWGSRFGGNVEESGGG